MDRHGVCEARIQPIDLTKNLTDGNWGRAHQEAASTALKGQAPRCRQQPPRATHAAVTLSPSSGTAFRRRHADANVTGCSIWFQPITPRKSCGRK